MKGKTNSQTGGMRGERVNILLATNQASHDDVKGAVISIAYESVVDQYTYTGSMLTAKVPPYVDYTISVSDVTGYAKPASVQATAVAGNARSVTMTYNTTIVKVVMADNQTSYNDISSATATVAATGITTATVSSGGTVKVPTGVSCTITWNSVSGYKTPDKQTFTTSGTSATKTGTYQTEILTVNVTSDIDLPASYTITVSGIGSQTTASKVYKVPFGTSYTVSATAADGYTTPASQSFTANSASRSVTVEYLEYVAPPVDLSLQDIYGNPTSQTTANCYVVKATGTYMFPLVFGNAIKDGATNSAAFTKVSGEYSHDFVDYKDKVITTPYIETMSGTASGAELSMADTDNIFSNISIVSGTGCRYIQFKVKSVPATGANGVISVLDSSGTVMWSWHIWVWPDDLTPVEITNNTGVKYSILPVNLATKKSTTAGKMYNWFYQWGRPTPMLPPSDYSSTTNATNYGVKTFAVSSGKAGTYGAGIQNPQMFYKNSSSPYNWFGTDSYYNLWDANCVSTGNSDNNVVKTVYDPCPPGFKIPNGNTFTYFSTTNVVGSFSNGWYFKRNAEDTTGVFFPASGSRYHSDGLLNSVGGIGGEWLSSASSQYDAYRLNFNSGLVSPQYSRYRAYGYGVRPVTDEAPKMPLENGVYIQAVDGTCYTESEWDGSKTPNGIAVLTDNCQFVMALQNAYSSSCQYGGYGTEVSGITTTTSNSTAATDYNGEANTTTIINALNGTNDGYVDGAPAAEYCRAFTFPNGATGYMGAAGEWQAALDNKAAITSALSKCGGTAMSDYYWTSTQYSSYGSWYMNWDYEYLTNYNKYYNRYVRAFAAI